MAYRLKGSGLAASRACRLIGLKIDSLGFREGLGARDELAYLALGPKTSAVGLQSPQSEALSPTVGRPRIEAKIRDGHASYPETPKPSALYP